MAPLPDTNDPFELLGLSPGAGEDKVRYAYWFLTSQYPPDTAPDEFARLHTAFRRALGVEPPPWMPPPLPARGGDGPYERFVGLLDKGRYDDLSRELAAFELADAPAAAAFLRAIAVVAWRSPRFAVERMHASAPRIRELGQHALAAVAEAEAGLASRFHRLAVVPAGSPLIALFGDHMLASPTRRLAVTTEVGALLAQWGSLLEVCDRIRASDPQLTSALGQRLQRESPLWGDRALAPLPGDLRDELAARLEVIVDPSRVRRVAFAIATVVAGVAVGVASQVYELIGYGLPAAAAAAYGLPEHRYRAHLRPRIATVIADLGVQADTVSAWVRANPGRGRRLRPYMLHLGADESLILFAAIAALVREQQTGRTAAPADGAYR